MRLRLQESDSGVQLAGEGNFLVDCWVVEVAHKGRVMGSDAGDVGVFTAAKFGVSVAICWLPWEDG